jgi:hypothetical protein
MNWTKDGILTETDYVQLVNDTVYMIGYNQPSQPPIFVNRIMSPLHPTIGSSWWGIWGGPARFEVEGFHNVTVPAGNFSAYRYEITDSATGSYKGYMLVSDSVGSICFHQISGSDTFSVVLVSYINNGGQGVIPLAVGNYGIMTEGIPIPNSIQDGDISMPLEFILCQNYPNPFNPTTKIKYQIPELSFVSLKVYDVLGNEVTTLVNEEKAIGTYEISWHAENLPSGVYFYQLKAGTFIETKKMILLR